jgi:7-carboxy-7-deazaguanine synthase
LKIAEIFQSRQGEGLLTGTPSVFIRVSGCNLRCWFCDTPYASWEPEGENLEVGDLVAQVAAYSCDHVVITGGEPMIFPEVTPLTRQLKLLGRHITIETAGTRYQSVVCDLMSISPKLRGSAPRGVGEEAWRHAHERRRHAPDVIRRLVSEFTYQCKFVVDEPADLIAVKEYLEQFPEIARSRVLLMPQGCELEELEAKEAWLRPYCQQHELRYCPRRQIEWYGLARGT